MSKIHSAVLFARPPGTAKAVEPSPDTRWAPNTDVYLAEEGLVVKVELAGLRREDLEIAVEGSRLIVSGHRLDCCRGANCSFLMMEINYGHFESLIELPPGYDLGKAKAAYQNGFLRVDVPPLAVESDHLATLPNGEC
jgi:HSP20 family protein